MKQDTLREEINRCRHIVCMTGQELLKDSDIPVIDSEKEFDIEMQYGYSPEEIYCSGFFSTRKEQFFDFYKKEYLSEQYNPCKAYYILADMEKHGKLDCVITTSVYGLERKAGCRSVIELYGTVHNNRCPRCKKQFDADYIKYNKKTVPLCDVCNTVVRPGVKLVGEMVDNGLLTKATQAVEKADLLILLGVDVKLDYCKNLIQYYSGNKIVLIGRQEIQDDVRKQSVITDNISRVLEDIWRQ